MVESKETLQLKPIDTLYLLVHPYYVNEHNFEDEPSLHADFPDQEWVDAMEYAASQFIPKTVGEYTIFMPYLLNPGQLNQFMDLYPTQNWVNLYKRMRQATDHKSNMLSMPDVLRRQENTVRKYLDKRGLTIGQNTQIVVGGGHVTACLSLSLEILAQEYPELNTIHIDKKASVQIENDEITTEHLAMDFGIRNYSVINEENHFTITKKVL
jgi:hypothetical protein